MSLSFGQHGGTMLGAPVRLLTRSTRPSELQFPFEHFRHAGEPIASQLAHVSAAAPDWLAAAVVANNGQADSMFCRISYFHNSACLYRNG
jgi:hypothetical protein